MDVQLGTARAKRPRISTELTRSSTACNACRERKVKCCGSWPCTYCTKRQRACVFTERQRKKLYPIGYVQALEEKVASQDCRLSPGPQEADAPHDAPASAGLHIPSSPGHDPSDSPWQLEPLDSQQPPVTNRMESELRLYDNEDDGDASTIVPASVSSSSLQFGNQIKSLGARRQAHPTETSRHIIIDSDDVYGIDALIHSSPRAELQWPTSSEARDLLNAVLSSVGRLQQLLEPRAFSDRLYAAYEECPAQFQVTDLWHVEVLMVLALGELLQGRMNGDQVFPGMQYYAEAERCLPNLVMLRKTGILAIEILTMMAFYLQCADRRDDAYVHAGLALRLAMSNGLAHTRAGDGMLSSEASHRVRLWWTVYMQERRLAAATGNPLTIHDEDVTTPLPVDFPGFFPPEALSINIRLARITGRTMDAVYGNGNRSVGHYTRIVKIIIADLTAVANDIPRECALDLSQRLTMTRTAATLYLMLYQCIILTTRPTLLHLARLGVAARVTESANSNVALLENLADACIEAANRSLEILKAMISQQVIANFGFFDLDAALSSAFVFVLVETIHPDASRGCGNRGIGDASNVLKYLTSRGNRAAAKRLADIEQICDQLGISISDGSGQQDDIESMIAPWPDVSLATLVNEDSAERNGAVDEEPRIAPQHTAPSPEFDWAEASAAFFDNQPFSGQPDQAVAPMWGSFGEGFSGFYFDEFALTGVVETDWEELSRQFND